MSEVARSAFCVAIEDAVFEAVAAASAAAAAADGAISAAGDVEGGAEEECICVPLSTNSSDVVVIVQFARRAQTPMGRRAK